MSVMAPKRIVTIIRSACTSTTHTHTKEHLNTHGKSRVENTGTKARCLTVASADGAARCSPRCSDDSKTGVGKLKLSH
ncbi:hypothetical protein RRG08_042377 [Elysia crispata]|uniref:Uncharacterized protein n=1 Tax=Elysia crispata TaxID=231223 RepID=A0AAE0ZBZ7_9GAST|nr:hypothetical protein RRG08_042377 [Elysia crispata]